MGHGRHATFAAEYPVESERKSAIALLLEKLEERKDRFKKWIVSPNSTTAAGFVATREIIKRIFSNMNYIKSKYRTRLTDESLQSCVKIKVTSYMPDVEKLSSDVRKQKSH